MNKTALMTALLLISSVTLFAQQQVFDKAKMALQPFNYNEVKLQNSPLKRQFDEVESYYLAIANDDLLKGFRQRAGLPVNGAKNLGGWYTSDTFHIFGQLLGGMSRLYAVSGNQALKIKVATLISEWAKTIDKDGYFFYSSHPNAKPYVYEKMVGGLVDAYIFTGNKQALQELSIITDWAEKNLPRERLYGQAQSEWYTLTENLYRAYEVTKDKKYLDFGKVWEYTDYWNTYLKNGPPVGETRHHAYSHLNTLNGAATAYLVSNDDQYKTIIENAYNYFQKEQVFATGGFGPNERLLPKQQLIETLDDTHNTFETQCGSWAIFKLSKYLMEITGDAQYGDWIEKMTINGIGANIPMTPDGKVQYYSDYNPREGTRHNHHAGWSCCAGTRPQAIAEYADLIYFKNKTGLFVNLYTPSKTEWNGLSVTQSTNYPESNQTEFTIATNKAGVNSALSFRNPGWAKTLPQITVNGKAVTISNEHHWLKVSRIWKNGDNIKITFPMNLYVDRLDDAKPYPAAMMYGPVAMAVNVTEQYPSDITDEKKLSSNFIKMANAPLNYKVKEYPDLTLRPYYQFAVNEPYVLYVDPVVKNMVLTQDMHFSGDWQKGRGPYFTKNKDASVSTNFKGTGITISIGSYKNSGIMKIEIDGKVVDMVDTFAANDADILTNDKTYAGLPKGDHKVVVSVSGEKNPKSKDSFINVSRFKAID